MDSDRFESLARRVAAAVTRREALAALLAGVVAGLPGFASSDVSAARRKGGTGNGRGKGKGKRQDRSKRQQHSSRRDDKRSRSRNSAASEARADVACCSGGNCTPAKAKNLSKCCYQGQNLSSKIFQGANLGSANFAGATLANANLQGANLGQACLVDADLRGIKSNASTNLGTAILCRTRTDSGENNSGCDKGTPCCPTCDDAHPCAAGSVCCKGRCIRGDCCDNGGQSTCDSGEICCGNTCAAGECCAAGQCPVETCQRKTCQDRQCAYEPVVGQPGPRCQTVCCQDEAGAPVCCESGITTCNAEGFCCQPPPKDETCGVGTPSPKCGEVRNTCNQKVDCGPCAERTCEDGACTGAGNTCQYTPVFGQPGTECQTVCCENAEGAPACCAAGTTICQTSGVCGCARNQDCGSDRVCCGQQCLGGVCCQDQDCPQRTCQAPDCQGNQCAYTPVRGEPGPGCQTVCCQDAAGDPVCCGTGVTTCLASGRCGCANCGPGNVCLDGVCVRCDVCASGCAHASVQSAVDAGLTSIRICPGTYATSATIPRALELLGSGSAADDANVTILDGEIRNRVLAIASGVAVTVRNLRIQRGRSDEGGGGVLNAGALTMESVAVSSCESRDGGGGIETTGSLTLTDCDIHGNRSFDRGGGIKAGAGSTQVTLLRAKVRDNRGNFGGGGINIASGSLLLKTGTSVATNEAGSAAGIGASGGAQVTLESGSSVAGNRAPGFRPGIGGGIRTADAGTVVNLLAGSSVTGNVAGISGGGVEESGGTVNVADTGIVTGNRLSDGTVSNCAPSGAVPNCVG